MRVKMLGAIERRFARQRASKNEFAAKSQFLKTKL
jgi:hypothetical protein